MLNIESQLRIDCVLLFQRLREAKDLADVRAKEEEAFVEVRKSNFGAQFDDFQGIEYPIVRRSLPVNWLTLCFEYLKYGCLCQC